jgi:hypothetical protein
VEEKRDKEKGWEGKAVGCVGGAGDTPGAMENFQGLPFPIDGGGGNKKLLPIPLLDQTEHYHFFLQDHHLGKGNYQNLFEKEERERERGNRSRGKRH